MASRSLLTVEDVPGELDAENEGDSEDDFDGYMDIDDEMGEEHENVGANVEIGEAGMEIGECEDSEGDDDRFVPKYSLQPGCSTQVDGDRSLQYLSLLITNDMLEHIVAQTNLSAQQFIELNDLAPHSRVRRWSKGVHDLSELKRFLSLIIVTGLVRYPQIENHWATTWPFTNSHCSSVSVCR